MALKCPACGYDNQDDALCCSLCQIVLRREAPAAASLPYAGWAEEVVRRSSQDLLLAGLGLEPDFSPASVAALDAAFGVMWGLEGDAPGQAQYAPSPGKSKVILAYGAYFGEACRRALGGAWEPDPGGPGQHLNARVTFPGGQLLPIQAVFKRLRDGQKEALFPLLVAAAEPRAQLRAGWAAGFLAQAELIASRGAMPPEQRLPVVQGFCKLAAVFDPARAVEADALARRLCAPPPAAPSAVPAAPDDEVLERARKTFIEDPKRVDELLARAFGLVEANKPAEALALVEQAFELAPQDARVWKQKAAAFAHLGRLPETIAALAVACDLAPSDIESWGMRALMLSRAGRHVDAARCWEAITRLQPSADNWRDRGWACAVCEAYDEALECQDRALAMRPGDPEILLDKVVTLDRAGRRDEALLMASTVLAVPDNLARLKAVGLKKLGYLASDKMNPALGKLIAERIGA